MDDGNFFAAGSDMSAVRAYQSKLARSFAIKRIEEGGREGSGPPPSPSVSSVATIPTASQATISSREEEALEVSFKEDGPPQVTPYEKVSPGATSRNWEALQQCHETTR